MNILVYLEQEHGKISEHSYDLISYIKDISNGEKISGVVVSRGLEETEYQNLNKYGLDKLLFIKNESEDYDKRNYPKLILKAVQKINPDIFVLNSTTEGREIAPVIASTLNTGLTADCTKLEINEEKLISTRPTFGGKLMASILCKTKPQMATLRVNIFKKKEFEKNNFLEVEEILFDCEPSNIEILNYTKENKNFYNLQNAKIILAGGMGLKNKEGFDKLKHLSKLMGAKTGASRKAVDKGFIEKEFQIGQTGSSVTPEIYIAFGISGAIHHIVGMENSKKIIAVNTDKNAPIFCYSDIGIIADANSVIDALINKYSN